MTTIASPELEAAIQIELTLTAGTPEQAEYHLENAIRAGSARTAQERRKVLADLGLGTWLQTIGSAP